MANNPSNKPSSLLVETLTGITQNLRLPSKFLSENFPSMFPTVHTDAKVVIWEEMQEDRKSLQFVGDLAPALEHTWAGVLPRQARMVRLSYFFSVDMDTLEYLRDPGTINKKEGKKRLAREAERLIKKIRMTEEVLMFKAFSPTYNYVFDGVVMTMNDAKDAAFKPTTTTAWSAANSTILADLRAWLRLGRQQHQMSYNRAFVSGPTADYFYGNTSITNLIQSTRLAEKMVADEWDQFRIANVTFTVNDDIYIDPVDSAQKQFIPDDVVCMIPGESGWSELRVGNVDIVNDRGGEQWTRGPASYSVRRDDPVGWTVYIKHRFLPIITQRNSNIWADLTP